MRSIFKLLFFFVGLNLILFSCTAQELNEKNASSISGNQDVNPPGNDSD